MSKDGGGYGSEGGHGGYGHSIKSEDDSLRSELRNLKIQIKGYRQEIEIINLTHEIEVDLLKAKVQMNIHNSAFNGLLDENKELKQYLKWTLATIENMMPELYDSDEEETAEVEERLKEIKGKLNE